MALRLPLSTKLSRILCSTTTVFCGSRGRGSPAYPPSRAPTELSDRAAGKIYFSGGGTRVFPPPAAHLQEYKTSFIFISSTILFSVLFCLAYFSFHYRPNLAGFSVRLLRSSGAAGGGLPPKPSTYRTLAPGRRENLFLRRGDPCFPTPAAHLQEYKTSFIFYASTFSFVYFVSLITWLLLPLST